MKRAENNADARFAGSCASPGCDARAACASRYCDQHQRKAVGEDPIGDLIEDLRREGSKR